MGPGMVLSPSQRWSEHLEAFRFWCQRTDWTADNRPDENRFNNCLAEAMAMAVWYLCGLELPADYIHDTMYPEGYVGYMSFDHAIAWFARYMGLETQVQFITTEAELTWWVWWTLRRQWTAIGLYYFDKPNDVDAQGNAQSGHFRDWTGAGGVASTTDLIVTADPWTGLPRRESPADHFGWSQNSFLIIPRKGLHARRH